MNIMFKNIDKKKAIFWLGVVLILVALGIYYVVYLNSLKSESKFQEGRSMEEMIEKTTATKEPEPVPQDVLDSLTAPGL